MLCHSLYYEDNLNIVVCALNGLVNTSFPLFKINMAINIIIKFYSIESASSRSNKEQK